MFAVSLVLPLITVLEEGSQKILATAKNSIAPVSAGLLCQLKRGHSLAYSIVKKIIDCAFYP